MADPEAQIAALPIWRGRVVVEPLLGGITNKNYLVRDGEKRAVVRCGGDIPVHGVMRFNELAASRAAGAAGVSPKVLYAAPSLLILDFIEGRTFAAEDVRGSLVACVALVKRAHRDMAAHLRGPLLAFNVFHIIRDYAHRLTDDDSRMARETPRFLQAAALLENAAGPVDWAFCHNDLLAGNFLDDGRRLWLIDWDYAGWGAPLFDLGGLSSNNGLSPLEDDALLEAYCERPPDDALRRRLSALRCASLLREAMWSMVSETHSVIDFDYVAYTQENLRRFDAAFAAFTDMELS